MQYMTLQNFVFTTRFFFSPILTIWQFNSLTDILLIGTVLQGFLAVGVNNKKQPN